MDSHDPDEPDVPWAKLAEAERFAGDPGPAWRVWARSVGAGDPDDGVEAIFGRLDTLLREGSFAQVDACLSAIDVPSMPALQLLAFASIASAARGHLSEWVGFLARVRHHLSGIEPGRVAELLAGFDEEADDAHLGES